MKPNARLVYILRLVAVIAPLAANDRTSPNIVYGAETGRDYFRLVASLATTNHEPRVLGEDENALVIFPDNYDWAEQERVVAAINTLAAHPAEAWPSLIAHLDDKRYCITLRGDYTSGSVTVGAVCDTILGETLAAAYIRQIPPQQGAFVQLSRPPVSLSDSFKKWLLEQQANSKTIVELQVEMCEWAALKVSTLAAGVTTEDERKASVERIRGQIAIIRRTNAPIAMNGFFKRGVLRMPFTKLEAEHLRAKAKGQGN